MLILFPLFLLFLEILLARRRHCAGELAIGVVWEVGREEIDRERVDRDGGPVFRNPNPSGGGAKGPSVELIGDLS